MFAWLSKCLLLITLPPPSPPRNAGDHGDHAVRSPLPAPRSAGLPKHGFRQSLSLPFKMLLLVVTREAEGDSGGGVRTRSQRGRTESGGAGRRPHQLVVVDNANVFDEKY